MEDELHDVNCWFQDYFGCNTLYHDFTDKLQKLQKCLFKTSYIKNSYGENERLTNVRILQIITNVVIRYLYSEIEKDITHCNGMKNFIKFLLGEEKFTERNTNNNLLNIVTKSFDIKLVKYTVDETKITITNKDLMDLKYNCTYRDRMNGRVVLHRITNTFANKFFNDVVKIYTDLGYVITEDDIISCIDVECKIYLKQDIHKLQITQKIYDKCEEIHYFPYGRQIKTNMSLNELEKLFNIPSQLPTIKKAIKINKIKPNMKCLVNSCKIGCIKYIEFLCEDHKLVPDKLCMIITARMSKKTGRKTLYTLLRYMNIEQKDVYTKYENLIVNFNIDCLRDISSIINNYVKTHKLYDKKTNKINLDNVLKSILTQDNYNFTDDIVKEIEELWKINNKDE